MIRYVNLKCCDEIEQTALKNIVERNYPKILRDVKNSNLVLHIKKYRAAGKAKYSLHARIEAPSMLVEADYATWDIKKVAHKVMIKLEKEIQHKFRK